MGESQDKPGADRDRESADCVGAESPVRREQESREPTDPDSHPRNVDRVEQQTCARQTWNRVCTRAVDQRHDATETQHRPGRLEGEQRPHEQSHG